MNHLTTAEIEAALESVLASPKDVGVLELIVRRPRENEREELETVELDVEKGLVGDNWFGSGRAIDSQITMMNSRLVGLIARDDSRRALAGDQLYVDLDLSEENITNGSRLEVGEAMLQVTEKPHNGCKKFVERFGFEAMLFVNSPIGKRHHLRGIYAKVIRSGFVRRGDKVRRVR
ncbi:MAG: MOSC domain-containing protein [Acidobacteria bacterium]|nr:MOSC domain-containing protein [Acidobacteriota bacterium]